jgi:hypothetical protein
MNLPTKDEVAERLAEKHYIVDSGVTHIYRLKSTPDVESDPEEPIKLLEVYEHAFPSGIVPIYFNPHPPSGAFYPTQIVQIAPEEFPMLGIELELPRGWTLDREYPRPTTVQDES